MAGTAANVTTGPGWLYVAEVGATLPTDGTTPLGAGFSSVGYTEDGSTFSWEVTTEDLEVAEELDPVQVYETKRTGTVKFSMAEATAINLKMALGGGVDTTPPTSIEPPALGTATELAIVLEAETGARWLFRRCKQVGNIEIMRKKAPDKVLIPVEFRLLVPASGALFTVWPDATSDLI